YIGVNFQQCFDMNLRRIRANTQVRSGFGPSDGNDYAMLITNCTRVKVRDSVGTGNWAGSDFGGGSTPGSSVNIDCGYEDSVLTANYSNSAGMHGNSINCGYNRCNINGPVALAGDNPYATNCD